MRIRLICTWWLIIVFLSLLIGVQVQAAGGSLMNLKDNPTKERFPLTDKTWPVLFGDASVCLWKDDKTAAVSFTVDDNIPDEHDWWIEQMDRFGWKVTWFIITERFISNPRGFGTWDDFIRLKNLGHDVQSHTVNHYHDGDIRPPEVMEYEYSNSIQDIEKHILQQDCTILAYPNGRGNTEIAARYFIAARGVMGRPNIVNRMWYMNTSAAAHSYSDLDFNKQWIDNILVMNPSEPLYWRGWAAYCFHDMAKGSTPEEQQASLEVAVQTFEYLKVYENELWIDLFVNIAKYAQERDTHSLTFLDRTPDRISFVLQDDMDDRLFDHPLTVKVCLGLDWTSSISAYQNGRSIDVVIVSHNELKYALVQAIPDRGIVVLSTADSDVANSKNLDAPRRLRIIH